MVIKKLIIQKQNTTIIKKNLKNFFKKDTEKDGFRWSEIVKKAPIHRVLRHLCSASPPLPYINSSLIYKANGVNLRQLG